MSREIRRVEEVLKAEIARVKQLPARKDVKTQKLLEIDLILAADAFSHKSHRMADHFEKLKQWT